MRKILIRKLGVGSVARFIGVANALWTFVAGVFAMFGGVAAVIDHNAWGPITRIFASVGVVFGCLIVLPLIGFLAGWLYGAVLALVANLFLHTARGIELDVEDEGPAVLAK